MEIDLKQKALKQLAQTAGEVVQAALNREAAKVAEALQNETQYDLIEAQIALLDTIAYRVAEQAVEIITHLLGRLETLELTYQEALGFSVEEQREYQNNDTLVVQALETLEHIRYHLPAPVLDIFFHYSVHTNEAVSKRAKHGIEALSGFDLDIFYGDGKGWSGLAWEPQKKVLEKIYSLTEAERCRFFSGIIAACDKILSPRMEGTNWTYNSLTLRSAAVPALQGIKDVRTQALSILKHLYDLVDTVEQKKSVLNAMHVATRTPSGDAWSEDALAMIMEDTATILQFMKAIVTCEDLQIIQKIEHDAYFFFRHGVSEQVKALALEVKSILDHHTEYQIFKILIGFEGVFSEWRSGEQAMFHDTYNYEKTLRERKVQEFAASITEDNYPPWKTRIINYASIQSDDLATFPYFGKFLEYFGAISSSLALRLLGEASEQLAGFMVPLLCGVWGTRQQSNARLLMTGWIAEHRYLSVLARVFEFTESVDEKLLTKIYVTAKSKNDCHALCQLISTISAQYGDDTKHLLTDLFLPALEALTSQKNINWISYVWYREQLGDMLSVMDSSAYQMILNNLLWLGKIDYQAEAILCEIAKHAPELVVQFFCNRMTTYKGDDIVGHYEAIPYRFDRLSEPLSTIPDQAVDSVLRIYDGNYRRFVYEGGRLLKNIFPEFAEAFESKLMQLIQSGDEKSLLCVIAVLRNYEGQEFLHEVCKELVKVVSDNESLLTDIRSTLLSAGVVSGAYGFVEAYKRKIEEMKPWLGDPNEKIQRFAQNYITNLEKQIEAEKQRADEDIILRKYQYGVSNEEENAF